MIFNKVLLDEEFRYDVISMATWIATVLRSSVVFSITLVVSLFQLSPFSLKNVGPINHLQS